MDASAERLGIGTSSPTGSLHLYDTNTAFRIQDSNGGNMQFGQWDNTTNRIEASGGNRDLFIVNYGSGAMRFGTNGSEKMRIDSSGIVTTPNQPAFDVSMTAGGTQTGIMVHDVTYLDNGNNHNTTNGHFTAPVTGVYYFYTTYINSVASAPTGRRYFQKNGVRIYGNRHLRLDGGGGYGDNGIIAITVSLIAGDYLRIEQGAGASYGTKEYEVFGGHLIG